MHLYIRHIIALALGVCVAMPTYAEDSHDKRKRKGHHTTAGNSVIVEPDRPALQARMQYTLEPQADFHVNVSEATRGHGHINVNHRQGIDVSHYQYTIDWERLAQNENISYAYIKATEGNALLDDYYRQNIEGAHRVGISVGSYHFYRPNVNWREQFEFMKRIVRIEEQDLVPLIDIEKFGGGSRFVSDLREFVLAVERHYGRKPLLYTYQNFYNKHLRGQFPDYPWMIACYSDNQPVLSDGQPYIMWQYSCKGRLSGIRGDVDRSCLMESYSLRQLKM